MTPYYQDQSVTLYHGDCREILPSIAPADLVLTDIPYGKVNRPSGGLREMDKGAADVETMDCQIVARLLAHMGKSIYVFCGTEQVSTLRAEFVSGGLTTRLGIWSKTNPSPMNGEHLWLSSLECCVFARQSGAYFSEHCKGPLWIGPTDQEDWGHETPKPKWLMDRLILASSQPGDTVLDPFAGAGTTLRSAKDLGRKAIGVELRESLCETIAQRLGQEVLAL